MTNTTQTGWYGTDYVARHILHIPTAKVFRLLYAGKVPKPAKMFGTAFCWTINEIEPLALAVNRVKQFELFKRLPVASVDAAKVEELKQFMSGAANA
jgi:hypothetical protein